MTTRYDFVPLVSDSQNERRLQQEALSMLLANKAAQRELDRREAAKDAMSDWARKAIAASRPAPQAGMQQAARDAMIRRQDPTWTSEPAVDPARVAAAMRMDGAPARTGVNSAAAARALMMRRLQER